MATPAPAAPAKKGMSTILIVVLVLIALCVLVPCCLYFGFMLIGPSIGNAIGNSVGNVFSEMIATLGTPVP
jgi:hypothetical protein